uniref:Chitin-binding type-2 domain-containing protein n=1 Tax=Dendroctonus ponderosae TaxID=77166 RepID=A0AAR5QHH3_DENPD
MERYHILKLGLAITFYAAYCIRPMLVYSLEADNELDNNAKIPDLEYYQYFQGVDGRPGIDFPVYSYIPRTGFSCKGIESGYYADLETNCQVFHICEDGRKVSFLCPNGTIFQQSELICEWWNKVNCTNAPSLYEESAERFQNDIVRRKANRRVGSQRGGDSNHGAIMRTEQRSSIRASKNGKDYAVRQQQNNSNRRIPDNNDIEQQIDQAESNNRYLANAQNTIQSSQKDSRTVTRQEVYPNHKYNTDQESPNKNQPSRTKQTKKDIDKDTGNYLNNNYDQPERNSKRIEQGQKNRFDSGSKRNQQKMTTFKEYHTQFESTPSMAQENKFNDYTKSPSTFPASTEPTTGRTSYDNTNPSNRISSTAAPVEQTTSKKFAYGTTVKERFSSYAARTFQTTNVQNNFRGSVKFNANPLDSGAFSTPITTYSPVIKYSTSRGSTKTINDEDRFPELPFPKHKSEQVQSYSTVNPPTSRKVASATFPGQIRVNVEQPKAESEESQIPQESSSFVKSGLNTISDDSFKTSPNPYPNHRTTYSDLKEHSYLEAPKISAISSITPHLVTTQPINNGKPFVGSRVGNTVLPNHSTTQSKYTYLPTSTASSRPSIILGVIRHSSTTELSPFGPPEIPKVDSSYRIDLFNTGETDKTLPPVETTTSVTNSLPTEIFNVGKTDTTIQANVLPNIDTTAIPPLEIYVPDHGSLNVGQSENNQEPVNEPPFIKKNVPLLYSGRDSTERTLNQATIYGTYPASTQRSAAFSKNTPYSPTVPTVTQRSSTTQFTSSSTPRTSNIGVPIRFNKDQEKISIHLSKSVGSQQRGNDLPRSSNGIQTSPLRVGAVVHVADEQSFPSRPTPSPQAQTTGFFITRGSSNGFSTNPPKSKTEKPRPFAKSLEFGEKLNQATSAVQTDGSTAFPTYHISSARPFGVSETTSPTPLLTTPTIPSFSVYDNVDNMIEVLQEIANFNSQKDSSDTPRPDLIIPPSVGPQTLHSLAQYFANELESNETSNGILQPETKEKLTTLLTAMTVHGYNHLFTLGSLANTETSTNSISSLETTTVLTPSRLGNEENKVEQNEDRPEPEGTVTDDELLSTTSIPELRQLARNFSLALSSYLNDPDNFKKRLEELRPTEPPAVDGSDNVESSTTEDELLNFSDADVKPSTSAAPSATWGYIIAAEANKEPFEDVKNSLNPDLNTADSQSFVPRFNNVQVDEKQGKGSTDLPPNHWTSSPRATQLWQKALSINPAVVNDHFESTTLSIDFTNQETTTPELFNADVLPEIQQPHSAISYDLRELPPLSLNSTQIHGILIDFMNHTKWDEHNRLNRILKKLNTSEEEFLDRMKEIESNPLTKRLILLLISECGSNITQELGISATKPQPTDGTAELGPTSASSKVEVRKLENHDLGGLVHSHLSDEDQDSRALQLLNSLYTIASKFGKRR